MDTVDSRIPLSGISAPIMGPREQMTLMELGRQMKLRNDVQNLMQTPGALDEQGLPTTQTLISLRKIDQGMGDSATMHRAQVLSEQDLARKRAIDAQRDLENQRTKDISSGIYAPAISVYYSTPGDETTRTKAMQNSIIKQYADWKKTGKAAQYQMDDPKFLDALLSHSPDDVASTLIAEGKKDVVEAGQGRRADMVRAGAGTGSMPQGQNIVQGGEPMAEQLTMAQPEERLQTDTTSGAQYRGLPERGTEGVPLPEVGGTPQQEQATAEQGPTLKDPNVLETTGGEPVLQVNVEGDRLAQQWLDRARNLEKDAEKLDNDASLGAVGRTQSKELRKQAEDLRGKAIQYMREDRLDSKATRDMSMTNFMKEAEAVYGKDTPKYKKAIEDHIKRMDHIPVPQWLAQTPDKLTAEQAGLTGDEFLRTLPPEEQITVKGVADLTIDPNSISTRNNQRQSILDRVKRYKPDYNQQDFKESQNAAVRFGSGPQGNAVRSFNVALEHLEILKDAAAAMGSGDVQRINAIRNRWRTETGSDLPTNFEAVKQLLSAETVKAIVGGGTAGALADREEAARTMIARSSPAQIVGVIEQLQHLFGGQIHGLEQQYKAATKRNDFRERYLTPIGQRSAAAADADIGRTPDMRNKGGMKSQPKFSKEEIDAEMKRRGIQ